MPRLRLPCTLAYTWACVHTSNMIDWQKCDPAQRPGIDLKTVGDLSEDALVLLSEL